MANKLEHAPAHAKRGFKIFPVAPGAKFPPLLSAWPKRASSDLNEVKEFWAAVPDANIGIHCQGMLVVDVDVRSGGDESLAALGKLPPTLTTRTPTGGRHLFFKLPEGQSVANSSGKLGRGIDIKTTGGYVLAPGSTVPAGEYVFEHDGVAIADAPEWLLAKLGTAVPKVSTNVLNGATAPDDAVARAKEWLAGQPVGGGRSYATACGLRDLGLSLDQARELFSEHDPRPDAVEQVEHAYKYAQNDPGVKVATVKDFPALRLVASAPKARALALPLHDFANTQRKGPGYLLKGLLQRRSYAELFGAPGEGKTFAALDIAYSVAAGKPWMNRATHAGTALYLAYEGTGGLVKRAQALRQHYGADEVPLYIASAAFNLREPVGRRELAEVIAVLPTKPVLVVIDTLARALMGGDENSAQDVGVFNTAVQALIDNTGACVLLIHHSGKNKSAGARGSSALLGAIDTELEIDSCRITARKQRDIELCDPIGFKLLPLVVGIDEDGDEITSCVVLPENAAVRDKVRLTGNAKRGMEVLVKLSPDNKPVPADEWQDACKAEFLSKTPRARQTFFDLKGTLVDRGCVVETSKGFFARRLE